MSFEIVDILSIGNRPGNRKLGSAQRVIQLLALAFFASGGVLFLIVLPVLLNYIRLWTFMTVFLGLGLVIGVILYILFIRLDSLLVKDIKGDLIIYLIGGSLFYIPFAATYLNHSEVEVKHSIYTIRMVDNISHFPLIYVTNGVSDYKIHVSKSISQTLETGDSVNVSIISGNIGWVYVNATGVRKPEDSK